MTLKDIIAACLVIALGIILALHFAFFWMYGGVFIYESNKVILAVETAMSATILVFGVERLICSAREMHKPQGVTPADKQTRKQLPARDLSPWQALPQSNRAAIATIATVSAVPVNTTLSIDSDACHTSSRSFNEHNSTEDTSKSFDYFTDDEHYLTVHTEVS